MACIIEIKKKLNASIDKLLGGYRDTTHSYIQAQRRSKKINDRWSNLSRVEKYGNDRAKIDISERVFEKIANEALELQNKLDKEVTTELDIDTTEVKPDRDLFSELEETTSADGEEDHPIQAAYKKELEKTGSKPTVVLIRGTKAILNDNGTYDLIDPSNNTVMQRNMDLNTMKVVAPSKFLKPFDNKVYDDFVKYTMLHPYTEPLLAEKGIDINDIFDELGKITTESELDRIIGKILKNIC